MRLLVGCVSVALIQELSARTDFFEHQEVVNIRIEAPFMALKNQRNDEVDWLNGLVRWVDSDGVEGQFDVKVKARGNFRRLRSTCSFPPFWLNFKKKQLSGTEFDGLDKVKIVSHCRDSGGFDQYLFKEYLCYRTLNLMTEKSFRVRLARIEYFDTVRKNKAMEFSAFFIEPVELLEERLESNLVTDRYVLPSSVSLEDLCLAELFQFFVGNTDFSFFSSEDECCHNGKMLAPSDPDLRNIPIPYDFDLSGIVDAPYSQVDPNFPNLSVRDRHYRGVGVSREILEETMNKYGRKKSEIYALWEESGLLNDRHLASSLAYIDEFYEFLREKKKRKREVIKKLRHIDSLEKAIQEDIDKEAEERATNLAN